MYAKCARLLPAFPGADRDLQYGPAKFLVVLWLGNSFPTPQSKNQNVMDQKERGRSDQYSS
ncbi:Uncharacterised protein [Vibrio cholerae]|uniref:Uncharacterized protein n=1 Tax=Vibrio cholerae TaxID=666 RepID=A0A655Z7Y3_VIBCL|nr:Uncharacterised protein [Vibrio cholerae]